jgi:ankyrin repeat protein
MQNGETLLMRAIKMKHMPVAQILVSYGANVNYPGVVEAKFIPVKRITYPIHQAVASESIEFTEWLIKNGACINEIFYEEETYQSKKSRFFSPKVTRATALDIAYNHNATLIIDLLEDNHAERYRTTRLGCLPMCC